MATATDDHALVSTGVISGPTPQKMARPIGPTRLTRLSEVHLDLSEDYELRTTLFPGWRHLLVGMLAPRRGDTVLDVGCGPGLNFAALQSWLGPGGRIIGIDESAQLLTVAARRVTCRGWRNVTLINAPVETAELPEIDAVLFGAAHEVLQSPAALTHIFNHLRTGAAVAAGGWKWPTRWLWPLRTMVTMLNSAYLGSLNGFDRPWHLLAAHLPHLSVEQMGFGAGYFAHGRTIPPVLQADTSAR